MKYMTLKQSQERRSTNKAAYYILYQKRSNFMYVCKIFRNFLK